MNKRRLEFIKRIIAKTKYKFNSNFYEYQPGPSKSSTYAILQELDNNNSFENYEKNNDSENCVNSNNNSFIKLYENSNNKNMIEDLKFENEDLLNKLNLLQKDNQNLQKTINSLQNENSELKNQVQILSNENDELNNFIGAKKNMKPK